MYKYVNYSVGIDVMVQIILETNIIYWIDDIRIELEVPIVKWNFRIYIPYFRYRYIYIC